MSIIKWAPFFSEFDDLEKTMSENSLSLRNKQLGFTPAVDVYEDKNNVIVETQLVGIDPEKVDISIENDVLSIKGEGEKKSEVEDQNYYRKEIRRGSFFRSIPLPNHVDGSKASAIAEEGILKIYIPKLKPGKAKTIKIQTKKK